MLRTILGGAGLTILGTGALAQNTATLVPAPQARDGGTYHLATKTWTRGGTTSSRGTHDVLYDNTCQPGWYTALDQQSFHDDGRIPSTSSPQIDQGPLGSGNYAGTSLIGAYYGYTINGFQIGYCTGVVAPIDALTVFYECYQACSYTPLSPTAGVFLSGLPGAPSTVLVACWTVTINLLGSTSAFNLQGDCDGVFDGSAAADSFGYGFMPLTPDPNGLSGVLLAGDPDGLLQAGPGGTGCCVGCGTVFWAGENVPGTNTDGSGLNDQDFFEVGNYFGGTAFHYNGCYWFGGYSATTPFASSFMEVHGDAGIGEPGVAYCFGHTSQGNPCPCGNDNNQADPLGAGCANVPSWPTTMGIAGARLGASGVASLGNDTLLFQATRGEPFNYGLFFQATSNLDGAGLYLGDGIQCAGGNLTRLKVTQANVSGQASTRGTVISARSAAMGYTIQPGQTLRYQWWFRTSVNPACGVGVTDSNTSNGYEITWLP